MEFSRYLENQESVGLNGEVFCCTWHQIPLILADVRFESNRFWTFFAIDRFKGFPKIILFPWSGEKKRLLGKRQVETSIKKDMITRKQYLQILL